MNNFINSFSVTSAEYGGSTYARMRAIDYYRYNENRNILFGMGFINGNTTEENYVTLHGTIGSNEAYYSDLGLLGMYFNIGLFTIIIFGLFYGRIMYILIKSKKFDLKNKSLIIAIFSNITLTSISLLYFSPGPIFSVPIFIAIGETFIET